MFNKEVHVDEHGVKHAITIDFAQMSDRQLDFTIEAYGNGGQLAAQTAAIAERDRRHRIRDNQIEDLIDGEIEVSYN